MGDVVELEESKQSKHRMCMTCEFYGPNEMVPFARCFALSMYASNAFRNCKGELWQQKTPEPPNPRGFWARLGDAIIERVKR